MIGTHVSPGNRMNSDKKWTTTTAYVRNTCMFGIYSISSVQFRAMYRLAAATATVCVRVWFDNNSTKQSDNWDIDQSHEEMPTVCTPAHRTFFQDICCRNWASIPSVGYNQGRSGLYLERIWASSNWAFLRKSCLKNGCFTIKSAPKCQNLEKIWENISHFFSCLFGI